MKKKILSITVIMLTLFTVYCCCKTEDDLPDSADRVLHALLEYPAYDLYQPYTTVIGIDVTPPEKADLEASQEAMETEKEAWKEAVGDCFAGNMFDTFFQQWERSTYMSYAFAYNLTATVSSITVLKQNDNIQHVLVTVDVIDSDSITKQFNLEWRLIYDKQEPELLQSVKLLDDDNLWDSYRDTASI